MAERTRVLLVGALGTVGVWVIRRFLEDGHEVIAADLREDFSLMPSLEGQVPFHQVDLLDRDAMAEVMRKERITAVCHIAAKTTGTPSIEGDPDPFSSFLINGLGPISVMDAAQRAGVSRFAYASTKGVYGPLEGKYGFPTYEPVPEDHPRVSHRTSRPYGASKIFAEDAGRYYEDRYGMSFRALRFGNIIRPGKFGTGGGGSAAFPAMVDAALRGEPYRMDIIDGLKDDVVYVKDVAQGLVLASTVDEVSDWAFNIATGVATTLEDYADAVRAAVPGADIALNARPGEDTYRVRCVLSIERAREQLGYEPEFTLEGAVADLAEHFRGLMAAR